MLSFKQLAVSLVERQSRITSLEVAGHLFEKKSLWNYFFLAKMVLLLELLRREQISFQIEDVLPADNA